MKNLQEEREDNSTSTITAATTTTNYMNYYMEEITMFTTLDMVNLWRDKFSKCHQNARNDILDTLSINYNPVIFDRVRDVILSMFYNLIKIKPEIRGKEKQALSAWCIYYPLVYNSLQINIHKLLSLF